MKPHMPKGLIRAIGALLTALALYSLLGFLILPGIALRVANQQLANYKWHHRYRRGHGHRRAAAQPA